MRSSSYLKIGLAALYLGLASIYCGGSSGGSSGGGTKPTAKNYVETWLPQDKVCLNYNEITTMVNGEVGIQSYVDSLVTEIENCTAFYNGPGCPYSNAKQDLQEFSDGDSSNGEFHSGDPKPFYLETNSNNFCQNNGTVEYNWDLTILQNPMILCISQINATNLNNQIKDFLIQYVDNHKENYDNLNLDYNPDWDNCSL